MQETSCALCGGPFHVIDGISPSAAWLRATVWARFRRCIGYENTAFTPKLHSATDPWVYVSGIGDAHEDGVGNFVTVPINERQYFVLDREVRNMPELSWLEPNYDHVLDCERGLEYVPVRKCVKVYTKNNVVFHENCWQILQMALHHHRDTVLYSQGSVTHAVVVCCLFILYFLSHIHRADVIPVGTDFNFKNGLSPNHVYSSDRRRNNKPSLKNDWWLADFVCSLDVFAFAKYPPKVSSSNEVHLSNLQLEPNINLKRHGLVDGRKTYLEDLPLEILTKILSVLPKKDVVNARVASRLLSSAPLTQAFLNQRVAIDFPYFLEIEVVSTSDPGGSVDWRTMYRNLRCNSPSGPDSAKGLSHGWRNRERIWELACNVVRDCWKDEIAIRKQRNVELDLFERSGCGVPVKYELRPEKFKGTERVAGVMDLDVQRWYLDSIRGDKKSWEAVRDVVKSVTVYFGGAVTKDAENEGLYPVVGIEFHCQYVDDDSSTITRIVIAGSCTGRKAQVHLEAKHQWIAGWIVNISTDCALPGGPMENNCMQNTCDAITGLKVVFGNGDISDALGSWEGRKKRQLPTKDHVAVGISSKFAEFNGMYEFGVIEACLSARNQSRWCPLHDLCPTLHCMVQWVPEVPPADVEIHESMTWHGLRKEFGLESTKGLDPIYVYILDPEDPVVEVCFNYGHRQGQLLESLEFVTKGGHTIETRQRPRPYYSRVLFRLDAEAGERLEGIRVLYTRPLGLTQPLSPDDVVVWTNMSRQSARRPIQPPDHPLTGRHVVFERIVTDEAPGKGRQLVGVYHGLGIGIITKPMLTQRIPLKRPPIDTFHDDEGFKWAFSTLPKHLCSGPLIRPSHPSTGLLYLLSHWVDFRPESRRLTAISCLGLSPLDLKPLIPDPFRLCYLRFAFDDGTWEYSPQLLIPKGTALNTWKVPKNEILVTVQVNSIKEAIPEGHIDLPVGLKFCTVKPGDDGMRNWSPVFGRKRVSYAFIRHDEAMHTPGQPSDPVLNSPLGLRGLKFLVDGGDSEMNIMAGVAGLFENSEKD